jgi:hypothetical protein
MVFLGELKQTVVLSLKMLSKRSDSQKGATLKNERLSKRSDSQKGANLKKERI